MSADRMHGSREDDSLSPRSPARAGWSVLAVGLLVSLFSAGMLSAGSRAPGLDEAPESALAKAGSGAVAPRAAASRAAVPSMAVSRSEDPPPNITFEAIAAAESSLSLRLEQVRRSLEAVRSDPAGARVVWSGIREQLLVSPDPGTGEQRFDLRFLGLEGSTGEAGSTTEVLRRELFRGHAGYLHLHAQFRIEDPQLAGQNYAIVDLGPRERLGRPTHRIALLPRRLGRNPWVLEVDAATSYPLFRAEYSVAGVLVSTLEVTSFAVVAPSSLEGVDWWEPVRRIESFPTVQAAVATLSFRSAPVLPRSSEMPLGYRLHEVRVVQEDLRPESSLVLTYTDGIDEIFLVSTVGAPAPALPVASGAGGSYAILEYRDHNVAQFLFHANSVNTMVIGRAGQFALPGIAHDLLVRALRR